MTTEGPQVGAAGSLRPAYIATLAASSLVGVLFLFQGYYSPYIGPGSDLLTPLTAGVATLSAFGTLRRYGMTSRDRFSLAWLGYAAGITLWFLGEVTWGIYADLLNVSLPYPSVADVFYLGGYIPLILGVYLYVKLFSATITRRRMAAVAAFVVALGLAITFLFIGPAVVEVADPLTRFFDFAYPLLDLVMLSLALLGFMALIGGTIAKSWALLLGAIALNIVADVLFTYLTAVNAYYSGSFDDLLFIWGYFVFALAFYVHKKEL